jgi:sigma-B regulation protein RsbU (phosphoserine phosphatase)
VPARRPNSLMRYVSNSPLRHPAAQLGSPIVRQIPITVLVIVAMLLSFIIPSTAITSDSLFLVGVTILTVATVLAALMSRDPKLAVYASVIPAIDFLAIAVLRTASGGTSSIFAGLVILPVVWFATNYGRRHILYACAGTFIVVLAPTLASMTYIENPSELLRSIFVSAIYALAATVINELSRQATQRYQQIKLRDAARAQDLAKGAQAQQALLPSNAPVIDGYKLAGVCLPAQSVGGDFYDWYATPEGAAITLGDVMGKGVGAGIIAATTRAVMRSGRLDADPVVALNRTDECLSNELSDMSPFATMFHARVEAATGRVHYVDAGHGLSVVVRADKSWVRLSAGDLPLGLGFAETWSTHDVLLAQGDTLISFSDGLLDLYGGDAEALERIGFLLSAEATADAMIDSVIANAGGYNQVDDVTVVALRRD